MQKFGPLQRKHGRTGVPADHFAPWQSRFAAVDHRGRITALVADGLPEGVDPAWAEKRREQWGEDSILYRTRVLGESREDVEAEAERAERIADLQAMDVEHDPPLDELDDAAIDHLWIEVDSTYAALADHEAKTITHSHAHAAMGDQGDDETHTHQHTHSGDASHNHAHKDSAAVTHSPVEPGTLGERVAEMIEKHGTSKTARMAVKAFKHMGPAGKPVGEGIPVELAVKLEGDKLVTALDSGDFGLVAAGVDVPQIVDNPGAPWHAYLCVEGIRTDEFPSRELTVGSCQVPDLPVSMRYLVEDEGGHYGAITCGRIDSMERQEVEGYNVWYAEGVFGTDENSQVAQLHVQEQTQRFVSIDPRDVDAEIIEVKVSVNTGVGLFDEDSECDEDVDWWVRYNSLVIGAATIVATPAIQQAVITMSDQELPWSSVAAERAPISVVASGAPAAAAPAEWFENPGFHVGDSRLIRQRDGKYACPLTVTEDGRIFGHAAYWGAEHTGFPGRKVNPPHSSTYAYFETGVYRAADGTEVPVGQVTMGCGHASTSLPWKAAAAHYDGGYGAVQMADVRAGEDDFGIWIAGAMRPMRSAEFPDGPTPEQVAQFRALGLSGDWRKIAGHKHFVACLAVPVPGFPISREALVAAGGVEVDARAVRAGLDEDGEITSLVAAGRVHRLPPDERLGDLERKVDLIFDAVVGERQREAAAEARARLARLTGGDA